MKMTKSATRPMTASPWWLTREALIEDALTAHSCPTSRCDFTQRRRFAIEALRMFVGPNHQVVTAFLDDFPVLHKEVRRANGLHY